jgi:hypothetical protein
MAVMIRMAFPKKCPTSVPLAKFGGASRLANRDRKLIGRLTGSRSGCRRVPHLPTFTGGDQR